MSILRPYASDGAKRTDDDERRIKSRQRLFFSVETQLSYYSLHCFTSQGRSSTLQLHLQHNYTDNYYCNDNVLAAKMCLWPEWINYRPSEYNDRVTQIAEEP